MNEIIIPITTREERTFYIANRVVFSIVMLFILTGIFTTLIMIFEMVEMFLINFGWIFVLLIPIIIMIYIRKKRKDLYYYHYWPKELLLVSLIWLTISVVIGVYVDYLTGNGKTLWVSITAAIYFTAGYLIAWSIRKLRFRLERKKTVIIFTLISLFFIILTAISGWIILVNSMEENNIFSFYQEFYGEFSDCYSCAFGALFAWSGFAIVGFTLCNYWMLYALYQGKSWDVLSNPPNRLYLCFFGLWSIILIFIWFFMEFLIPPIPGGGGGSSGSGGGGGGGWSSKRSRNKANNMAWMKYNLGGKKN